METSFNPTYYNTLDQIYHSHWAVAKLSRLALLRRSIATLWPQGHPTRLVQVAGTSGKGSTCRLLEAGMSCFGPAGAFLGPHLFDYRERFSINGVPVAADDITAAWETRVKPHCIELVLNNKQHSLKFHEVNLLIALTLFEQHQVAWAAMETGVGGRYDQTTALDVVATALTNVGRDHEHLLGRHQWQRVLDKAGVVRRGVPHFTSAQDTTALAVLKEVCRDMTAPLHIIEQAQVEQVNQLITTITGDDLPPDALLTSEHQRWNAALSLAMLHALFPEVDMRQSVTKMLSVRFLGRFWQVADGLYADIAHNPDKLAALAAELTTKFAENEKIFVVGVSGKRSTVDNLAPLLPLAKAIIVTEAAFKGKDVQIVKQELETIHANIPIMVIDEPKQALTYAQSMQQGNDIIILTGSTYMIDQVLNPDPYLHSLNTTWGWRRHRGNASESTQDFPFP